MSFNGLGDSGRMPEFKPGAASGGMEMKKMPDGAKM